MNVKCGKVKQYYYANIKQGLTTSCGCKRDENVRKGSIKHKIQDLIGKKYNRLTIIGDGKRKTGKKVKYLHQQGMLNVNVNVVLKKKYL